MAYNSFKERLQRIINGEKNVISKEELEMVDFLWDMNSFDNEDEEAMHKLMLAIAHKVKTRVWRYLATGNKKILDGAVIYIRQLKLVGFDIASSDRFYHKGKENMKLIDWEKTLQNCYPVLTSNAEGEKVRRIQQMNNYKRRLSTYYCKGRDVTGVIEKLAEYKDLLYLPTRGKEGKIDWIKTVEEKRIVLKENEL